MSAPAVIRVVIIDARSRSASALARALEDTGFVVLDVVPEHADLATRIRELEPDAVIIGTESPDRDTLEGLAAIGRQYPRPIVVLSERDDTNLVRNAMQLGLSAYVVESVPPSVIRSLIQVSMIHFRSQSLLLDELSKAQQQQQEQKLIHEAKCAIMDSEHVSEKEAYHQLRKLAMSRSQRIVDVARIVLQRRDKTAPTRQASR
jgi:response regulator NasT